MKSGHTILVGGTGEVSRAILARLIADKTNVVVISRSKKPAFYEEQVEWVVEPGIFSPYASLDHLAGCLERHSIKNFVYTSSFQVGRKSFLETSDEEFHNSFWVNSLLPILLTKKILLSRPKIPGSFVYFSTEAVKFGGNRIVAYAASKSAMNTFVAGAAKEHSSCGLRFNTISPSVILSAQLRESTPSLDALVASVPLQRLGRPIDMSDLVSFLLSDNSSFINGSSIPITGGR
jgi:NAD(P)-dependent dehydrogenase (short-subunit alcohol dehydrogenase family)